jgi:uncharacterized damage-inducible protein DinB
MSKQTVERLKVEALDGYDPVVGRWLWTLEATRSRLKEALEGASPSELDWTPPEGGNSLGSLLYHIAAIEADWLYVEVLDIEFPREVSATFPYDVRDGDGRLSIVSGLDLADHLGRLDRVRGWLLDSFRAIDREDFRRLRHFDQYSVTPEWVLHHLIQHEAEHRGQILQLRERIRLSST